MGAASGTEGRVMNDGDYAIHVTRLRGGRSDYDDALSEVPGRPQTRRASQGTRRQLRS
jgi:hypothetical protein